MSDAKRLYTKVQDTQAEDFDNDFSESCGDDVFDDLCSRKERPMPPYATCAGCPFQCQNGEYPSAISTFHRLRCRTEHAHASVHSTTASGI